MDVFTAGFYKCYNALGLKLQVDDDLKAYTYYKAMVKVDDGFTLQHRPFTAIQPMTMLGKMTASLTAGSSSLDGVSAQFVTPEGGINMSGIADMMKQMSGLNNAGVASAMVQYQAWDWADCHVPLLFNMLRYIFIHEAVDTRADTPLKAGIYTDSHVTIDLDQFWPADYPQDCDFDGWPSQSDRAGYPTFRVLNTVYPASECVAIDLRALDEDQARFVLFMTAAWTRTSRIRADFSTPKLGDAVWYRWRGDQQVSALTRWFPPQTGESWTQQDNVPELLSVDKAWQALVRYVTLNRLYDHFSAALYIFCSTFYQFHPATAESTYWLNLDWHVNMPRFSSIRGRFSFINEGEAALVSQRALDEWGYIDNHRERINLMALTWMQAAQTGIAVWSVRSGLEVDPKDLDWNKHQFLDPGAFMSAAVAEATKVNAPMPGMLGVSIYCDHDCEAIDNTRRVKTSNTFDGGDLNGYEVVSRSVVEPHDMIIEVGLDDQTLTEAEKEAAAAWIAEVKENRAKRLTSAKEASSSQARPTRDEKLAESGRGMIRVRRDRTVSYADLVIPRMTFAGMPLLIMPINPFPYNSLFTFNGEIDGSKYNIERRGIMLKAPDAWLVANLLQLAGYDLQGAHNWQTLGPKRYFAPNNVHYTWPVLLDEDYQGDAGVFTNMVSRGKSFMFLPDVTSRDFTARKLKYETQILHKGLYKGYQTEEAKISGFGDNEISKHGGSV